MNDVPLLRMRGIVKDFPGVRALDGVDLDVRAGEVHCLLGQNGAGKSTLIKVLAGAHRPDAGTLQWRGEDVTFATPAAAPLPDDLTPREAEVLGLIAEGLTNAEIAERLVVSAATVKSHVNHIFSKIGARDRAQAVVYAYANLKPSDTFNKGV